MLCEAVARLPRTDVRLVLMGYGPEEAALKAQARELGIEIDVRPWHQDTESFYTSLDIFCSSSRVESFGFVMIEAMAFGLPVVATQTDGATEILRHKDSGILVPQEDPEALAAAFQTLAQDRDMRRRLGAAARREVETRFTPEAFQERLTAALRLDVPPFGTYAPGVFQRLILFCVRLPGRGKWRKIYRRRWHGEAMDVIRHGFRLRVSIKDNGTDRTMLFSPGCFNSREVCILSGWLTPGDVFVDVGANTGLYASECSAGGQRRGVCYGHRA